MGEMSPALRVDVFHMADVRKRSWHRKGRRGNVARFEKVDGRWQSLAVPSHKEYGTVIRDAGSEVCMGLVLGLLVTAIQNAIRDGWDYPNAQIHGTGIQGNLKSLLGLSEGSLDSPVVTNWVEAEQLLRFVLQIIRQDKAYFGNSLNVGADHIALCGFQNQTVYGIAEELGYDLALVPIDRLDINPLNIPPDGAFFSGARYADERIFNTNIPQPPETVFNLECPCGVRFSGVALGELDPILDVWSSTIATPLPLDVLVASVRYGRNNHDPADIVTLWAGMSGYSDQLRRVTINAIRNGKPELVQRALEATR